MQKVFETVIYRFRRKILRNRNTAITITDTTVPACIDYDYNTSSSSSDNSSSSNNGSSNKNSSRTIVVVIIVVVIRIVVEPKNNSYKTDIKLI